GPAAPGHAHRGHPLRPCDGRALARAAGAHRRPAAPGRPPPVRACRLVGLLDLRGGVHARAPGRHARRRGLSPPAARYLPRTLTICPLPACTFTCTKVPCAVRMSTSWTTVP